MKIHCLVKYTIVKYTSHKYLWSIWKRNNIKTGEATNPDFYSICVFSIIRKRMNWVCSFPTSIGDHNLLISVKFFLLCHRWILPCIQYVTLRSQTNNHDMHIDSHVEFLLDSFQKLLVYVSCFICMVLYWMLSSCPAQKVVVKGEAPVHTPQQYGSNKISDILNWSSPSYSCTYRHISKVTFLSTVSHRLCDILYFFLKLKSRHINLYSFHVFIQGFMKQFESEMLKILLLLFLKSNLHHVGIISSHEGFLWASIWVLKERENDNFMSLMLSRNVEALHQYIYLSLGIIIIN